LVCCAWTDVRLIRSLSRLRHSGRSVVVVPQGVAVFVEQPELGVAQRSSCPRLESSRVTNQYLEHIHIRAAADYSCYRGQRTRPQHHLCGCGQVAGVSAAVCGLVPGLCACACYQRGDWRYCSAKVVHSSASSYLLQSDFWLGCPLRRPALGHPSINDSKTAQNRTADVPILTHLGVKWQGVRGQKGQIWYFYGVNGRLGALPTADDRWGRIENQSDLVGLV
jgi:hypothetical protein